MKIAVTGATGFLGEHLCLKLRQLGHELFEYNSKNLDLSKPITLPNSIDVLYHLAANARVQWAKKDPFADFKINALGTLNVLESVRKSSIKKIIYVSSCLVYKELIDSNEKDAVGTNEISGPYGISKLVGEYYIKEYAKIYGIDYVILRPTGFYGPGMKKNAIFDIIEGILNK
ncbi:MAG: NAD(P)-dependent oxidoreductase, partial [Candidatus Omnitrophica bacterium]|nr:NAD(P)-dependent oxidoreductase [Candidatus Omnitrophota bacterium]